MKFFPIFFLILIIGFNFISAVPEIPMIITGDAYINDKFAKTSTEITAKLNGENIVDTKVGEDGKFSLILQKLEDGKEVEFYVDGIYTNESVIYKSGDFKELTLKVEKSYLVYYALGLIVLIGAVIIWKRKK